MLTKGNIDSFWTVLSVLSSPDKIKEITDNLNERMAAVEKGEADLAARKKSVEAMHSEAMVAKRNAADAMTNAETALKSAQEIEARANETVRANEPVIAVLKQREINVANREKAVESKEAELNNREETTAAREEAVLARERTVNTKMGQLSALVNQKETA